MIAIDDKARSDDHAAGQAQEVLGKTSTGEIKASVTPTAETKTIAGFPCKVHNVSVEVPFSMGGPEMQMALVAGPACLSRTRPVRRLPAALHDRRREGLDPRRSTRRAQAPARRWPGA